MDKIKTLDDLKRIREEALEKRKVKTAGGQIQVVVGMGPSESPRGLVKH